MKGEERKDSADVVSAVREGGPRNTRWKHEDTRRARLQDNNGSKGKLGRVWQSNKQAPLVVLGRYR